MKLSFALHWIDGSPDDFSRRAMGVTLGTIFAISRNFIPKRLTPLSTTRCEPVENQALQRFSGWIFVLAGLGYAIAWLLLPVERARLVATLGLALSVLIVSVRYTILLQRSGPLGASCSSHPGRATSPT